jgi:type II secretory pathway pseudopilin PulG
MFKIQNSKFQIPNSTRGALLLELLIVISLLAIILSVGTQAVYVSLQSGKISGERDVAVGLASEALEAVRGVSEEKWQNIYDLTKTPQHYKTVSSGNKWTLVSGDETIAINNASYTRYVVIENVSRDAGTRMIDTGTNYDTSTQKVTVTVSWTYADPVVIAEYFFRWKNKVCTQTGWTGNGLSGNTVTTCPTTTYDAIDTTVSTTTTANALELI